jgi:hypothetical protein
MRSSYADLQSPKEWTDTDAHPRSMRAVAVTAIEQFLESAPFNPEAHHLRRVAGLR